MVALSAKWGSQLPDRTSLISWYESLPLPQNITYSQVSATGLLMIKAMKGLFVSLFQAILQGEGHSLQTLPYGNRKLDEYGVAPF